MGEALVKSLQRAKYSVDEKLEKSFISLFGRKPNLLSETGEVAKDNDEAEEQNQRLEFPKQYQTDEEMEVDMLGEKSDSDGLGDSESSDHDEGGASDEDSGDVPEQNAKLKEHMKEHVEFHAGRLRRKAVFGEDLSDDDTKVNITKFIIFVI